MLATIQKRSLLFPKQASKHTYCKRHPGTLGLRTFRIQKRTALEKRLKDDEL